MTGSSPEAIRDSIRKVAEGRGYQLVLDRGSRSVLFSAASIDLTSVVIDAMRTKGANPAK
jgi:Skp family chaperone for outer membrane proteins